MRKRRNSWLLVFTTVAALLALGLEYEQSFVHTDDGCAVEIHCLACRLAVAGTAVVARGLDVVPRIALVSAPAPVPERGHHEDPPRTFESRGPPLS